MTILVLSYLLSYRQILIYRVIIRAIGHFISIDHRNTSLAAVPELINNYSNSPKKL